MAAFKRSLAGIGRPVGRYCRPDAVYGVPADNEPYDSEYSLDPRVSIIRVVEAEAHDEILKWIGEGRLNPDEWVSQVFPWSDYEHAFDLVSKKKADKVVLEIH